MFGGRRFSIVQYVSVGTLFAIALQPIFVFAQTASPTLSTVAANPFSNATLLDQARKQCQATIARGGVSSVFNDDGAKIWIEKNSPGFGSPSGNVASYDIAAIRMLNFIAAVNTSIELLLKERNFSDDCFKVLNMANAQRALNKDLKKTRDDIVNKNLNQPDKVAEKIIKKNTEQVADALNKSTDYQWKEEGLQTVAILSEREIDNAKYSLSKGDVYAKANGTSRITLDDMYEMIILGNNPYDQAIKVANVLKQKNGQDVGTVYDEANKSGGIVANRICVKTTSGANPEEIDFADRDCEKWEAQPIIINQEKVKQLINAPYNQAFSPSAELGIDGTLSNLNTRINNGTLFAQNVGDNFGTPGQTGNGSLTDAEKIKNQLINSATSTPPGTVTLGILIHQAVIDLYQSSTSSCIYVPVTERQATLVESKTKQAELTTYKDDLTKKWAEVIANPKTDYTNFFLKLTIDLANKYSKSWIESILNDAKEKATKCATAKAAYTSTASSTNPNISVTTP